MIQDFKKYLFDKSDPAYRNWLFPQSKSTLTFGLIATFILNVALSIGDYYYYEEALKDVSIQEWIFNWNNMFRLILFPIINIITIFLSISNWNNKLYRLELLGVLTFSFAVFSNLYMSIMNDYYSADDFATGIAPFIIISQMIYGFSFRTSFILNLSAVLLTFFYLPIDDISFLKSLWTYNMVLLTWVSMLLGSLKIEQYRIQNFHTISELANAQQEIEEQKQLLRAGETVSQMFSWKTRQNLENASFSEGIYDVLEIDRSITNVSKILNVLNSYVVPEHQKMVMKYTTTFLKGKIVDFPIYKVSLPSGKIKWLKTSIEDKNDNPFFHGTIQDITSEKLLELELKKQTQELQFKSKELQSRNEELEQFAYASSHDLQEPLRTISNFAKILNKKIDHHLDEETRNYMNLIVDSTIRMRNLISDILDYSQIGKHKVFQNFDCNLIVENVIQDLNYSLVQSGGKVIIENDLPNIVGLQTEFTTLLQNLIGNALKFQRAGVQPIVIVRSYSDVILHHFCIQDNGIGMEQKHANKVFGLFSRLHTKDQYTGTGIGLTHSKKIVELHGGKIWVESTIGKGTLFHFSISRHLKTIAKQDENQLQIA